MPKKGIHREPGQNAGYNKVKGERFEAKVNRSLKRRKAEKAGRKAARRKK